MKLSVAIAFSVMAFSSLAQSEELGPIIGNINIDGSHSSYRLNFDFGIEQWEGGKLSTHRRQQWVLQCDYPELVTNRPNTWCSLKRVVIDEELTPRSGAIIGAHWHYSSDGTLKLLNADWERGRLEFIIVYSDKSTTEVMLRMKLKGNIIYLDGFKAMAIARGRLSGTITTIEYKIPQYTYALNVPVMMQGLRSMGDKEMDEMVASLSKEDQKIWEDFWANIYAKCKNLNKVFEMQLVEKSKGLELLFAEELTKCLPNTKISAVGQKKITDTMKNSLTSRK